MATVVAEAREAISAAAVAEHVPADVRREAVKLDVVARHEPHLRENGIPDEVLTKLLPGDEVIVLEEPEVAGGLGYRFVKRVFDVCSCGIALIVLAIPMSIVAIKIKLESPGPVIYAQRRVGLNGREFDVYKFRSMYIDAEKRGAQWATDEDPRVTPFGRWMRDRRLAPVIIGTPGDGEPTKSLSHPVNSSLDLHKCERRPEPFLVAQTHYTSFQFLSFAVFGGLGAARRRSLCARGAASLRGLRAVA
ncbi:sugar transferase [Rubneribacter badeniensis]|nr:sugar transferase [Rubneribacter badeniensis]